VERLNLKTKLTYSSGNLGVGLVTGIHMFYLVYFFFPPQGSGISYVIPQGALIFGLTVLGLILFANRAFDAVTDPWVANRSDNSQNKKGRRIPYMRKYALPKVVSFVLVFCVPFGSEISTLNTIWVLTVLMLSALFLTLYAVPYYTLLMEIAHHKDDKVDLGTYNSIFWLVGFQLAAFAPSFWELPGEFFALTKMQSIQVSFMIMGAIGLIFLYIPALFLDEEKLVQNQETYEKVNFIHSIKSVLKNKDFVVFLSANTLYSLATYVFETGLIYFVTVLAMKAASVQGPLTIATGALMVMSYPFINVFVKKRGKKGLLLISFFLYALTFALLSITGMFGINTWVTLGLLVLFSPIPQAALGMLPHVVAADCAEWDKKVNNNNNAAVYVALTGFTAKFGASVSTIFFTAFLVFGKDIGNDLGIRMAAIFGAASAIGGFFLMTFYNEKRIMSCQINCETEKS